MDKEKDLNITDLENILGGAPRKVVEDKILENVNLYRKQQIEELQQTKEALLSSQLTTDSPKRR